MPELVDPDRPERLMCKGEIIPVEEKEKNTGVAAAVSSHCVERFAGQRRRLTKGGH